MPAIHRTCDSQTDWQVAEAERITDDVVCQLAACLAQQLIYRHVAGRHAQQVAGQAQALRTHLALAGDGADVDAADMAQALVVQGFINGAAQVQRDVAALELAGQCGVCRRRAHVHQGGDGHALILQVEGRQVAVVVAGEDHRTLPRLDRVQLHQPLRGAGQHDPGQVVVAEHHRLVERTGRDQAASGTHLVQACVLDHRQVVVENQPLQVACSSTWMFGWASTASSNAWRRWLARVPAMSKRA